MVLPEWNELSVKERRSIKALYERIRVEVNDGGEESHEETPVTTKRNISVTVNDGKDPVEGATVSIGESTGTTGSAGGCTLQNVVDGQQSISVTAEGYTSKTETITVSADNTSFTISIAVETSTQHET